MLTVTTAARSRLLSKLQGQNADEDVAMRFTRRKTGWKLGLDRAKPNDKAITHEGRVLLVLDADVAKAMAALTLDARPTEHGTRLKLNRTSPESE